jgi:cell division protein FtsB
MTQKTSPEKLKAGRLQSIDPSEIADESLRQAVEVLLNLIEQQQAEIKALREENQQLRDENNRLKGEQGKPEIKAKNNKGFSSNHS